LFLGPQHEYASEGLKKVTITAEDLKTLDAQDPLAWTKEEFHLPEGMIYLDGNSLGALPKKAVALVAETVTDQWGNGLVSSWNDAGWFNKPLKLGDRIAPLIGAGKGTVAVTDSISVNLFKLVCAALALRPEQTEIISDISNFPSDLYVLDGISRLFPNIIVKLIGRDGTLEQLLGDQTAVVVLTAVDFRTGATLDMASITRTVQGAGALMLWDLAHSAGATVVALDSINADMAVGCTYKYLNAGPGAPSFLYLAERHHASARTPIAGWFGHADPFAFSPDYVPSTGISQFLCGTPPVLSYAPLEASLDIWEKVDMADVRAKSLRMTSLFMELIDALNPQYGFEIVTPREVDRRGSQVSMKHPKGLSIMRALIAHRVVGDFRAPDILRFGITPLTLSFADVHKAVQILDEIMATKRWRDFSNDPASSVT
jgi:kynureninase